ncbi:LOW QUALITY PROTEIN: alkylglycerol monooxygenase-like [Panulirus ornatus]|uniref:LOW QUALITY PROTEIN: alkylglycerol monooxygenase-like n=1 Tax=Panulirus ornatus TaxID=150431 RepID=UPI003A8BB0E0
MCTSTNLEATFYAFVSGEEGAKNDSLWMASSSADTIVEPTHTLQGIWWVMWLVVLEYLALWWQDARLPCLHDNILSLAHAALYEVSKVMVRGLEYGVYTWVWQHWAILSPPGNSLLGFLTLVVMTDLGYYWLHRAGHEVSVLWAIHQVHHTSQDLTVAVGLRHSPLQRLFSWVFYLPLALLGIPPTHMLAHAQFNLLYQCWIHTEAIRTLGPLEHIFNTPSHHRVHHGVNKYCLDKNYGGVFILWDHLFGTFQKERPCDIDYGIVNQPERFNPLYHQVFYLEYLVEKASSMENWRDRISTMVKGPSWVPGSPWTGWEEGRADIRGPREFQQPRATSATHCYVLLHFLAACVLTHHLAAPTSGSLVVFVYSVVVVAALTCIGILYEQPGYTRVLEMCRCGGGLALCLLFPLPAASNTILQLLTTLYAFSLTVWIVHPNTLLVHTPCKS